MSKLNNSLICLVSLVTFMAFVEGYIAEKGISSEGFTGCTSIVFIWQMVSWMKKDAIQRNFSLPFDMGLFIYLASYIVVPIYLYKTRGFKRALYISVFFLVYSTFVLFLGSIFAELV